jgi:hypothetical protein
LTEVTHEQLLRLKEVFGDPDSITRPWQVRMSLNRQYSSIQIVCSDLDEQDFDYLAQPDQPDQPEPEPPEPGDGDSEGLLHLAENGLNALRNQVILVDPPREEPPQELQEALKRISTRLSQLERDALSDFCDEGEPDSPWKSSGLSVAQKALDAALAQPERPVPGTTTTSFELLLSQRLCEGLRITAEKEGISKADVVRRALGLYALALEAESQGQLIGFASIEANGSPQVVELIRLHGGSAETTND